MSGSSNKSKAFDLKMTIINKLVLIIQFYANNLGSLEDHWTNTIVFTLYSLYIIQSQKRGAWNVRILSTVSIFIPHAQTLISSLWLRLEKL